MSSAATSLAGAAAAAQAAAAAVGDGCDDEKLSLLTAWKKKRSLPAAELSRSSASNRLPVGVIRLPLGSRTMLVRTASPAPRCRDGVGGDSDEAAAMPLCLRKTRTRGVF